jgi:hypothetical protein
LFLALPDHTDDAASPVDHVDRPAHDIVDEQHGDRRAEGS